MGSQVAAGFAEAVEDGLCTLDHALEYHFTANHFPPLPVSLVPVAKRALVKAARGEWDANVSLRGTGVSYKGSQLAPVSACMESWHLYAFLPDEEEFVPDEDLQDVEDDFGDEE